MADRPITFSAPMIRALLDGRKTQTRRVLKPKGAAKEAGYNHLALNVLVGSLWWWDGQHTRVGASQPYPYAPGDRLWVREAWQSNGMNWGKRPRDMRLGSGPIHYAASDKGEWQTYWGGWKPSIHMPRWASRLTLTVTDVRVQRLQEISRGDSMEEGCPFSNMADGPDPRDWFRDLWNSLRGPDAWDANPWVCALTFTVHRCNIDHMPERAG